MNLLKFHQLTSTITPLSTSRHGKKTFPFYLHISFKADFSMKFQQYISHGIIDYKNWM